jgi:hypothetical protein
MVRMALVAFTIAVAVTRVAEAKADAVLLTCYGAINVMQGGKQTNPVDESYSLAITVDTANKSLTVNEDEPWPLSGDTSHNVIAAIGNNVGSATLNRVTGAVSIHTTGDYGLRIFRGICKPAQRLF